MEKIEYTACKFKKKKKRKRKKKNRRVFKTFGAMKTIEIKSKSIRHQT